MTDAHPGVEDEVERALRLGLATAAQMADRLARARQDLARQAQQRAEQEARELEARFRVEAAAAAARLTVVDRAEWWHHATAEQIAGMYELAAQWSAEQPAAAGAIEAIALQVRDRYGIDLHAPDADPDDVRTALERIELDRAGQSAPRTGQREDLAEAVTAVVRAEQRDAALESVQCEPDPKSDEEVLLEQEPDSYDSAARRERTETALRETDLPDELIAVAMRADVAHARPAAEAAASGSRPVGPRGTHARGASRGVHRPDRAR